MSEAKRNTAIDLVKALAIIGVLVIHITSIVLTQTEIASFTWGSGLFWGSIFRASVPLFLMASGAIMLEPGKKLSLKKLYLHNILRIVVAMMVWGFAYKVYHLATEGQLNLPMLWHSFKRLVLFDQEFHFYYIHIILVVYVLLPIMRLFVEKADKKMIIYALCVWFALGIAFPTLKPLKPFSLLSGLTGQWEINLVYSSVGYSLFGYYLKKYYLSRQSAILSLFAGVALIFGGTFLASLKTGILNELFLQGNGIGALLLATGLFSLAMHINLKGVFAKIVTYISKASFCIYLSHMFILYILQWCGVTALTVGPAVVSVPLIALFVLCVTLGVYWVLSKIPLLNKYII